jgi:hypothetical protein
MSCFNKLIMTKFSIEFAKLYNLQLNIILERRK